MQKDLFGTASVSALSTGVSTKTGFGQQHRFSIRLDQAIALLIGLLVVYVLIFSFGVETGKRYAMAELKAERAKRELIARELSERLFAEQQNTAKSTSSETVSGIKNQLVKAATLPDAAKAVTGAAAAAAVLDQKTAPAAGIETSEPKAVSMDLPAGRYTIQVLTVASKATADKEINRLVGKGLGAFIFPGSKKLQICVNGFETRDRASQVLKQLRSQRVIPADAYVRNLA